VALARLEPNAARQRFLRRVQRERLTIRKLVATLEAEGIV
jgi:hypothetical protein